MKRFILYILLSFVTVSAYSSKATVIIESDKSVVMENGSVRVEFPKRKIFDITKLTLNGKDVIKVPGYNTVPWTLTYKGPQGENPVLLPSHCEYAGYEQTTKDGCKALEFRWNLRLSYEYLVPVVMTVSLPDDSELLRWDFESGTPEGWVVSGTQFPRITVARPDNAKLVTSAGWGAEYTLGNPTVISASYPSVTGSMQLLLLHNAEGSVYFATEDYDACAKDMRAAVGASSVTLLSNVVTSEGWSNQNDKFVLPWSSVIAYSNEGWEDAAVKWYRPFTYTTEWGSKTLESRNIPQWVLDTDVWVRVKGISPEAQDAVRKCIDLFGKGLFVHQYYWHNYPYDTHYPDYFPAKPGFEEWITEVQSKGCHIVPYINGRLWDPSTPSYKALNGATASCRKADGTLYTEIYPTSKVLNTVTCPASELWQGVLTDLVDKIQGELKTNGVYIDQIACAFPQPCWAENHGHAKGGGDYWHKAYRKLMKNINENHMVGDNMVFSEENAECYIDMFDLLLTVNSPHKGCRIVPLFPMIYSDRLLTAAYNYHPIDRVNRGDFLHQTMQCFLFGSQLGWVDPMLLMKKEAAKEATFLKNLTELRKNQHDVFIGGRYMKEIIPGGDNPVVNVHGFGKMPVVGGSEWLSPKGQRVQYYVNMDTKDHEVILPDNRTITVEALKGVRINLK